MTPADLADRIIDARYQRLCDYLINKRGRFWLPIHPNANRVHPGDIIFSIWKTS